MTGHKIVTKSRKDFYCRSCVPSPKWQRYPITTLHMKKLALTLFSIACCAAFAQAQTVISQWTFETNPPMDVTDSATGPSIAADVGNGTAVGVHADPLSDWTTPQGNGSPNSYSAVRWATGDYWQFSLSTAGFTDIFVTFSATGSATGPRDFSLQYSTTGTGGTFVSAGSYMLASSPGFSGTYQPVHQYSFDLSGITGLDNNADVVFRLVQTSAIAINGGAIGTAGSSRVDDFFVSSGGPIVIPEPATYMLMGIGILVCAQQFRRRKNS